MKSLEFVGSSREELLKFPRAVYGEIGFQLERVQDGLLPDDWKPMTSIGAGVFEIRTRDESGAYRAIYVAKYLDTVFVLHCFQKKTQQTAKKNIDLARERLQTVLQRHREKS
jgi:phage-related protein